MTKDLSIQNLHTPLCEETFWELYQHKLPLQHLREEITQSPGTILGYSNQDLIPSFDFPTTCGKSFTLKSSGLAAVLTYNSINHSEDASLLSLIIEGVITLQ